jgi:4a-hydroxytetrahydrobiopterin dehydratase
MHPRGLGKLEQMSVLSEGEIQERLREHGSWTSGDGSSITREISFEDFPGAVAFVNRVAEVAEEQGHHPDILIHGWNKVRLTLSTHSQGGLTDADFELAGRLDPLV